MNDYYFLRVWVVGTTIEVVHCSGASIDIEIVEIDGAVIYDLVVDGPYVVADVAKASLTFDGTDFSGLSIANQALMTGG